MKLAKNEMSRENTGSTKGFATLFDLLDEKGKESLLTIQKRIEGINEKDHPSDSQIRNKTRKR